MKIKFFLTSLIIFIMSGLYLPVLAIDVKEEYPRLVDYYLEPLVPKDEYDNLAKYDLLILDVDTQTIDPSLFTVIKQQNPEIQFLSYIPSQSVNTQVLSGWARFRKMIYDKVSAENWWLRDSSGNIISFSDIWPTIKFVDIGRGWTDYLTNLVKQDVISRDIWDGVFYDMVFANLSWLNKGNIDINKDGQKDSVSSVNSYWQTWTDDLMKKTKAQIGLMPLVVNLDIALSYEDNLNGVMMENFPAKWLGANSWSVSIDQYLNKLPALNKDPQLYIINVNTDNTKVMDNYRKLRFGLASTLLGDGYFSFDSGDQDHSQTWWYDEYNEVLGRAQSEAYNLLDKNDKAIKPGLWRRDFEYGIAMVNSTSAEQAYVFSREEFEKINGTQDRRVNDGSKTNWVKLAAQDGIILLKINTEIENDSYNNGSFVRVFNQQGAQVKNGFFAYKDNFAGNTRILVTDIDGDNVNETLINGHGIISVYDDGKEIASFQPYGGYFKGEISFAVSDLNGDGSKEIITGAGPGGGPHVRVFSKDGQPLIGGFFAYDKDFRGGVNVAVIDLNGDGTKEIITGAGPGGGPHVRVFSKDGQPLIGGFFAYDKDFRGGVNVAVGDVNGDKIQEIITGPGPGGGPHVRVFSKDGNLVSQFFAYDQNLRNGIMVMADDIDNNGVDEILVSAIE